MVDDAQNQMPDDTDEVMRKVDKALTALASSISALQSAQAALMALRPPDIDEAQATSFADLIARDAEWVASHIKPVGLIARRVMLKSMGNRRPIGRIEEALIHLMRDKKIEEVRVDRRLAYRWIADGAGIPTPGRVDQDRLPRAIELVTRILRKRGHMTRGALSGAIGGRVATEMIDAAIAHLERCGHVTITVKRVKGVRPTTIYKWVKTPIDTSSEPR